MARGKINIDNYEAWFLDYVEGNLDNTGRAEVLRFVQENPDLSSELDMDFDALKIAPEQNASFSSMSLKMPESELDSIDALMISDVEGLLNASQKEELAKIILNKTQHRNLALYRAAVLKPVASEKFDFKSLVYCDENFVIHSENEEEMMIACAEGLLLSNEVNFVKAYVHAHHHENKFKTFATAKLRADASLIFADKESLKRRTGIVIPLYVRIAAAAAVIAALVFIPFDNVQTDVAETVPDENPILSEYYFARLNAKETRPANEHNAVDRYFVDPDVPNIGIDRNFVVVRDDEKVKQDTLRSKTEEIIPIDIANDIIHIDSLPGVDFIEHIIPNDEVAEVVRPQVIAPRYRSDEPIGLLTSFANDKLGTDIAFTRKKDLKSDEYIAYHVKFGRFEFERKKSR